MTFFQTIKSMILAIGIVLIVGMLLVALSVAGSVAGVLLTLFCAIGVVYFFVHEHQQVKRRSQQH